MKKLLFAILSISTLSTSFSQSINWNVPVTVAMGSMYNNVYPRLSLTTGDNPIVVWENPTNSRIYTSRLNGASFTSPVTINPMGVSPFIATWAGAEIASSGDTVFVVFSTEITTSAQVYTVRSLDGGVTFQDTVRVDQIGTDIPRFPAIGVGLNGNPVVNFMRLDAGFGNAEYAVARSMNGGVSYMASLTPSLDAVGTVCDCCPASIATAGDKHILMYRNNDNNIREMWASYSTDGSASYNASAEIDQTNWMIMSCPSSGPSGVIIGDSLVSVWMSDGNLFLSTANINDQQISVHRNIFPMGIGTQNFPIIAGKGDTLAVVWQASSGSGTDIFFTYSYTGTAGLGADIDTLTLQNMGNQTRPDIEFANGKFHIVYSDEMSDEVKYLSGSIEGSADINVNTSENGINIVVSHTNGLTAVNMNSSVPTEVTMTLVNSMGQSLLVKQLNLNNEKTSVTLPQELSQGIYYVVLTSESGEISLQKVFMN